MNKKIKIILANSILTSLVVISSLIFVGCDLLDTKEDLFLTDEMLATRRYQLFDLAYKAYSNVPYGFIAIDNNLFAGVSDEAMYVSTLSATQRFNEGSWNSFYNPDDQFGRYYNAIYDVNYYLENSENYIEILGMNRDTMNTAGKDDYYRDIEDVERLRAEVVVLRAYYYLELAKRYGGVPIIDQTYSNPEEANLPRNTVDEVINKIVSDIDAVKNQLVVDWSSAGFVTLSGRITQGVALSIKARALLYSASPLFNTNQDKSKWEVAAKAANDVIEMGIYSLNPSYSGLFITDESNTSKETIWAIRLGQDNSFERANYPIGTPGGGTGITPSHNLVKAYEYQYGATSDPYQNLDPRFSATILKNGDNWNGRTLEIYTLGTDDPANENASPTGYYLKKFLNENLNLTNDAMQIRSWIAFRYAETLLVYAEAMNEAYGPDMNNGSSLTARQAVDMIRARGDVGMPPLKVSDGDQQEMRDAIKHERFIELAFEDHRYWDLKRWGDAEKVLNEPIMGVEVSRVDSNTFSYQEFEVAKRVFQAPKMNLFPIPEYVLSNSKGVMDQNDAW